MSNKEILQRITDSLVGGKPDETESYTAQALDSGIEPLEIIDDGLIPGMDIVGDKFQTGEYFLPHLIIAAAGMKQSMELLEPELGRRHQTRKTPGTVVIGTVKGDIHEIGKSLVATMLTANGFEVHDLGVDVSTDSLIDKAADSNADIIALSALLTTTMTEQRKVIEELTNRGLRDQVKVIVGGAPVSHDWSETIGADGYAEDAIGAVALAKNLLLV
ncbi:MAG: corrinoid protein [Chloroflexota bacterium]